MILTQKLFEHESAEGFWVRMMEAEACLTSLKILKGLVDSHR